MGVDGHARDPWSDGNYVFGDNGEIIGRAARVTGLDDALQVAAGRGGRGFPDIHVAGMDDDLERWVAERQRRGDHWTFTIKDNRADRWVRLRAAFVHIWSSSSRSCVWAINGAELADDSWTT